ncbi:MAG: immunoglobulin domain-containing protein [Verrucomicrobia bacterium]|nr:immunoglobulin domain-containing protein [Verrucomicrobiota bacterium]
MKTQFISTAASRPTSAVVPGAPTFVSALAPSRQPGPTGRSALLPLLLLLALAGAASASTVTWTGAGGNGLWHNRTNWSALAVPGTNDDVIIGGTTNVTVYFYGMQPKIRSLDNSATLWVQGNWAFNSATLTVAAGLTNRGRIRLESDYSSYDETLKVENGGMLINAPTGVIEVNQGSGGNRYLTANVINRGIVTVGSGEVLLFNGLFTLDGGSIAGSGEFRHDSGRLNFLSGVATGRVNLVGVEINLAGTAVTPCTVYAVGSTNRLMAHDSPAVTLWVQGNWAFNSATLTVAAGLTNRGRIRLESDYSSYDETLKVENGGTLINAPTGVIEVNRGSGGNRYLTANVVNRGTVSVGSGEVLLFNGLFTLDGGSIAGSGEFRHNSGRFNFLSGVASGRVNLVGVEINLAGTAVTPCTMYAVGSTNRLMAHDSPAVTLWVQGNWAFNSATLTVAAGLTNRGRMRLESDYSNYDETLKVEAGGTLINGANGLIELNAGSGGNRYLNCDIINRGSLVVGSRAYAEMNGHFTLDGGALAADGAGEFRHVSGRFDFLSGSASGNVDLRGVEINLAGTAVTPCTVYAVGNTNRLVAHDSPAVTLWVQGNYAFNSATLTAASGLTNRGRIRLESDYSNYDETLKVESGGTLVNGETGILEVNQGSGGNRYLNGSVANRGLIQLAGAYLDVNGTSFLNEPTGVIAGSGTLDCSGVAFQNQGTVSPKLAGGLLSFAGNYVQSGMGRLEVELASASSFSRLAVSGNAALTGVLGATLLNGYSPGVGSIFRVLTCNARSGQFAALEGLNFATNAVLQPVYATNAVDLQAVAETNPPVSAPQIVTQPRDQTVAPGGATSFAVTVRGTSPFTYQWQRQGTNLPSATNAALNLSAVQPEQAGNYRVIVANSVGSVTSVVAVLTVLPEASDIVRWDGGGNGWSWHDPRNWSNDHVPNATNRVIIDLPGAVSVVVDGGSVTIGSLRCEEALTLSDAAFTVKSGASELHGPFTVSGGSLTVNGAGASFLARGDTTYSGTWLYARNGGILHLPTLQTLNIGSGQCYYEANGTNSLLDLSSVTNIVMSSNGYLELYAYAGGRIDLSRADAPSRTIRAYADGAGSVVDLSGFVGRWTHTGPYDAWLDARAGGHVLIPNVTEIVDTSSSDLSLRIRNTGFIPTAQLVHLSGCGVRADHAAVDLTGLTDLSGNWLSWYGTNVADLSRIMNINGTELYAREGAALRLTNVTTFSVTNGQMYCEANGPGSVLDLSSVTNIVMSGNGYLELYAYSGGWIDLSHAAAPNRTVRAYADGAGSVVDLNGFVGRWTHTGPYDAWLDVRASGVVLIPNVTEIVDTSSSDLSLRIRNTGFIPTAQLVCLSGCGVRADHAAVDLTGLSDLSGNWLSWYGTNVADLSRITNINGSFLYAREGAVLRLPNVTTFSVTNGQMYLEANGTGSLLDLSSVTNVVMGGNGYLELYAYSGGWIDLSHAAAPSRTIRAYADGASSVVDLSGFVGRWMHTGPYDAWLEARAGGAVLIPNLAEIVDSSSSDVSLRVRNTGVIPTVQLRRLTGCSVTIDGKAVSFPNLQDTTGTTFTYLNGGSAMFPPAVDVVVAGIQPPVSALAGQPISLAWTIRNQGTNPASGPRSDAVWLSTDRTVGNDTFLGHFPATTALAPGQEQTVTNTVILPFGLNGSYYFIVMADSQYQFYEAAAETNNTFIATNAITISAPDLSITSFTGTNNSAKFGDTFWLTWVVKNNGAVPASAVWRDRVYLSQSASVTAQSVLLPGESPARGPLAAGESYTNSFAVTLPLNAGLAAGNYYLVAVTDQGNGLPEANENNNTAYRSISLTYPNLPDLAVRQCVAPVSGIPGQMVQVTWAVSNIGPAGVTNAVWSEVVYLVADEFTRLTNSTVVQSLLTSAATVGAFTFTNTLGAGEFITRTQSVVLPLTGLAGDLRVVVEVDARNEVVEGNETNNVALATNTTTLPLVLSLQVPVAEVMEGATNFTLTALLQRNGDLSNTLTVTLTSGDPRRLALPQGVTIPANEPSVPVLLTVLHDAFVTPDLSVTISASAVGFVPAQTVLRIVDVDRPSLLLNFSNGVVALEGSVLAAEVTRTGATNEPLLVAVVSEAPSQLASPGSVTIAAGQRSATFLLLAQDDALVEPDQVYTVTASAAGYPATTASVGIRDDDLPALELALSTTNVSEGAGPQAVIATLRRQHSNVAALLRPLVVALHSSDTTAALVPATVTIAAGHSEGSFFLAVADDGQLDGPQAVEIVAEVLFTGSSVGSGSGAVANLVVLDNDGPTLTLTLGRTVLSEGTNMMVSVRRNTGTNGPLAVMLNSSNTNQAAVPASVTIPNGADQVSFSVTGIVDGVSDGNQFVTLTASAPGHTSDSAELTVTDLNLPDLVNTRAEGPTRAFVGDRASITYRVENLGLATFTNRIRQRVSLSPDPVVGEDILVGDFEFQPETNGFGPGAYFEQNVPSFVFTKAGDYWGVVTADVDNSVAEIDEANNTRISSAPIHVEPDFDAVVQVDLPGRAAPAGTPVPLSGRVTMRNGQSPLGRLVNLHLAVREFHRVISALVENPNGSFATSFIPLPGEAGYYTVGAARGGEDSASPQDSFILLDAAFEPSSLTLHVAEAGTVTGWTWLTNLSEVALNGLAVDTVGLPQNLTATLSLSSNTLSANGAVALVYAFTATGLSPASAEFHLRVATGEGLTVELPISVTVEPLRPRLVAEPTALVAGMVRGSQRVVEFQVRNLGSAPSGPLNVALPGWSWFSLASTNPLPSLAPGSNTTVTLLLTPPSDLTLTEYHGQLALVGEAANLAVPFSVRALSEARGDLKLTAVDEYTYYAEGAPPVTNANVLVRDTLSGAVVTNGVTDNQGEFFVPQIMEGYYDIEVRATQHTSYRATRLLLAGQTNEVLAFLAREMVRYVWTVVPTEIEDRTRLTVETVFETVVPIPVVTVEPSSFDLSKLTNEFTQIDLVVTNHGLIAANNTRLYFGSDPLWKFTPLISQIGRLPARSSLRIPLAIQSLEQPTGARLISPASAQAKGGGGGACSIPAGVCWEIVCGPFTNTYCGTIYITDPRRRCPGGGSPGGGSPGGGSPGGGGGSASPVTTLSLCDCEFWNGKCLEAKKSVDLPGVAGKLVQVLGKVLPPPLKLTKVDVSLDGSGQLCVCCIDGRYDWAGQVVGTAGITVVAEVGLSGSLPEIDDLGDEWTDVEISASMLAGLRLTGSGNVEVRLEKICLDGYRLCAQGGLTLNLVAGVNGQGSVKAKFLGDLQTYEGSVSGRLDLEGQISASISGCSGSGFTATACGEATFHANLQGQLKYTDPILGELSRAFSANGDVELLKRTCVSAKNAPQPGNGKQAKELPDLGPLVEQIPGDAFVLPPSALLGQMGMDETQAAGVCARVRLRLDQEAVLARDAFEASLEIINASATPLQDVSVEVAVTDAAGVEVTNLFGIRPPILTGFDDVSGHGVVRPETTAVAAWTIVPAAEAAPTGPTEYLVKGVLKYVQGGQQVRVPLAPASITVYPAPKLIVDYFHQRDVFSDDPFTAEVEPAIPYSLAVMVQNKGQGTARKLRITSAQPQIVENEKGLLIDFNLIASEVAGRNITPSLTVELGDIVPGANVIGRWLFISSLQGLFIDYKATFEHLDTIAGRSLSLIDSVNIHEMVHSVRAPFGDNFPDFLVNDETNDLRSLPEVVYLSDGSVQPVLVLQTATTSAPPHAGNLQVQINAPMPSAGFAYLRVPDPQGYRGMLAFQLVAVRRSDGVNLHRDNFWQTDRTFVGMTKAPVRENLLHLFDYNSTGQYTLIYEPIQPTDTVSPSSSVAALPPSSFASFPATWSGTDNVGGPLRFDVFVSVDGGLFTPWLSDTPWTGAIYEGELGHSYAFYSVATDAAGNRESLPTTPDAQTAVTLINTAPTLAVGPNETVAEGATVLITNSVSDANTGQIFTFSLGAGSPPGATINSASGLVTWPTSETTGPSTNVFTVIVSDNGLPPMSATGQVLVIVREVNLSPTLAAISDRVINEGRLLVITNVAWDNDWPLNTLRFSMTGAPAGASLDPNTGVFRWEPDYLQGPCSNCLSLVVIDDGTPPLSATQQFCIVVRDSRPDFALSIGTTNVFAGETNHVPVWLDSGLELTRITFELEAAAERLANLSLPTASSEVMSATLTPAGADNYTATLTLNPAMMQPGSRVLATLGFTAVPLATSAIVPLRVSNLGGLRTSGEPVGNAAAFSGRVIVVAIEPVLDTVRGTNGALGFTLYGHPGTTNVIEAASVLAPGAWSNFANWNLTNRWQSFGWTNQGQPSLFLRAKEQ